MGTTYPEVPDVSVRVPMAFDYAHFVKRKSTAWVWMREEHGRRAAIRNQPPLSQASSRSILLFCVWARHFYTSDERPCAAASPAATGCEIRSPLPIGTILEGPAVHASWPSDACAGLLSVWPVLLPRTYCPGEALFHSNSISLTSVQKKKSVHDFTNRYEFIKVKIEDKSVGTAKPAQSFILFYPSPQIARTPIGN